MIKFVYKMTRPDRSVQWFARPDHLTNAVEKEKELGNLVMEDFEVTDQGRTVYATAVWKSRDVYSNYVNSPEMLEWRSDRAIYNSKNNITFELYTKIEDWEPDA